MLKPFRPSAAAKLLLCLFASFAFATTQAQTSAIPTPISKQLDRIDLGVSGFGEFTNSVTGTNYLGITLTQKPSTTLGALVNIRYTKSPLLGVEFNYSYARYSQKFTTVVGGTTQDYALNGGAQTNASEYTIGYLAHTPRVFGLQTFVAAGAGSTAFRATPGGGQNLPTQARMTYYYTAGAEDSITPHFGIRAQFRQAFFLAPDFGQNYLTIKQRQITTEPAVGFYLHF